MSPVRFPRLTRRTKPNLLILPDLADVLLKNVEVQVEVTQIDDPENHLPGLDKLAFVVIDFGHITGQWRTQRNFRLNLSFFKLPDNHTDHLKLSSQPGEPRLQHVEGRLTLLNFLQRRRILLYQ